MFDLSKNWSSDESDSSVIWNKYHLSFSDCPTKTKYTDITMSTVSEVISKDAFDINQYGAVAVRNCVDSLAIKSGGRNNIAVILPKYEVNSYCVTLCKNIL